MDYPKIERDNIDFYSNSDVCNIGYYEGDLRDGRPYRLEVWSNHGLDTATIFISNIGLENKSEVDLVKYISGEGIIEIDDDRAEVTLIKDINENDFYSINLILNKYDEEINKLLVSLNDYDI
jgi:hypothetical protein